MNFTINNHDIFTYISDNDFSDIIMQSPKFHSYYIKLMFKKIIIGYYPHRR